MGQKIFSNLLKQCISDISIKVPQWYTYFAHSESVILGMLAEDGDICRRAMDKILELLSETSATTGMESSTLESNRKEIAW